VQFPAGALPANTIVVIERLPNPTTPNAGPLPTTFNQYPLFYDFSTTPHVAQFAQPVTVAICQLEVGAPFGPPTQTVANRLQLAHPNPANPSTLELLPREAVSFIDCDDVSLAQARQRQGDGMLASALGTLRGLGTRALAPFRPTKLYAVHGGLGGKTTSFSPFGAVDPGTVTPLFGQLALGYEHGCAIANDGETYCWGHDGVNVGTFVGVGALGRGTIINTVSTPAKVVGGHLFTNISAHDPHTCGLLANGTAMCWGRDNGSLGRGFPSGNIAAPAPVLGGPWSSVSAGLFLTCAIDLSNAAWCWGFNESSKLGNPTPSPGAQFSPVPVATNVQFQSISAGWVHGCALTAAGDAYCWGSGIALGASWPGLPAPAPPDVPTPTLISSPVPFTNLAAGGNHTCGITSALVAYCWGQNGVGQLGDGTTQARTNPLPLAGNVLFVMIAPSPFLNTSAIPNGGVFTCGLASTGQAYCWGDNQFGQLGDGTTVNRLTPTPVATPLRFVSIATGRDFTCAMTANREVYCWGDNSNGDLGSGTVGGPSLTPVRVPPPF
jgi:alpha-tubulin suppressor-like RCC1 family protein